MRLHILGICGTFMGGIARIARELGHEVSGCDANIYPPMSDQLRELDIALRDGYDPSHLDELRPELVVVGNALSRGNPIVEAVLERGLRYTSGAQWLADHVLADRWVLAVAGTHGKTTTASLLAWILEHAGLSPGFLIGGVPENFGVSARLGAMPFFVIEADEYDTAFFDKRSKFVHYRPRTLALHNLEFDHADIFDDLDAIKRQFHHLVRTVPGNGLVLVDANQGDLAAVLEMGCWTPVVQYAVANDQDRPNNWLARLRSADGRSFTVTRDDQPETTVRSPLLGRHNVANALAAMLAARHAGVALGVAAAAIADFRSVKRRLELIGDIDGIRVYDDFAHHPTAIRETLSALRATVGANRILCAFEPRSNTMRLGVHQGELGDSFAAADQVFLWRRSDLAWDPAGLSCDILSVHGSVEEIVAAVAAQAAPGDHIIVMSNGAFDGLHSKLLAALTSRETAVEPVN